MPTRECVSANRARSDAIRKSQASASSKPPVTATPLIAPMSGFTVGGSGPRRSVGGAAIELSPVRDLTELLQVDAGGEGGIGAGEDEHVDVVALVAFGDDARQDAQDLGRQRVARLRPVQGDRRDAIGDVDEHDFAHCMTPQIVA